MPTEAGGGAGKVAFVDTEGTFRPERVKLIAERYELDPDAVLDNVSEACALSCMCQALLAMLVLGSSWDP